MKQNGVVCWPGAALLFFIFRFEFLISGQKSYRDFRETGPVIKLMNSEDSYQGHPTSIFGKYLFGRRLEI